MGVLIKNFPMPKDCDECEELGFFELDSFICFEDENGKHCPLVEVKESEEK